MSLLDRDLHKESKKGEKNSVAYQVQKQVSFILILNMLAYVNRELKVREHGDASWSRDYVYLETQLNITRLRLSERLRKEWRKLLCEVGKGSFSRKCVPVEIASREETQRTRVCLLSLAHWNFMPIRPQFIMKGSYFQEEHAMVSVRSS